MEYDVIATGSSGNAVVIGGSILVDVGVPFKTLSRVYKNLKLVLLTHIHSDHFQPSTIKRLADERATLRFGCCEWLVMPLVEAGVPKHSIDVYEIDKVYDYGAFKISPVRLCHNVPQCGYRIFIGNEKALYATDTANLDGIEASDYDLYLIEGNYTEEDLQERINAKLETGEYCYELNVANRHLSKEQAEEFLLENMGENSRYEYLHGHREKSERENENVQREDV